MKKTLIFLLVTIPVITFSCESAKETQVKNNAGLNTSICDKEVRYFIEKLKMIEGGNEIKVHTEITFNPTTKIIKLKADDPERGKISFYTEIESINCSFNDNLTSGQAVYKGYIKQDDGRKTFTSFLIENKDGQLYIKGADGENRSQYFMIVDRWEIVEH
jgi:hypothetical protein